LGTLSNTQSQTTRNRLFSSSQFYAHPGGLIDEAGLEWCRARFSNLTTVDTGPGIHFIQEDNPHLIGKELSNWIEAL